MQGKWKEILQGAGCQKLSEALSIAALEREPGSNKVHLHLCSTCAVEPWEAEIVKLALDRELPSAELEITFLTETGESAIAQPKANVPSPTDSSKPPIQKTTPAPARPRENQQPKASTGAKGQTDAQSIFGKPFARAKMLDISQLHEEEGRCKCRARVFKVDEPKEIPRSNRILYRFSVTDENDSIGCQLWLEKDKAKSRKALEENIRPGAMLEIHGEVFRDKYTGFEETVNVGAILKIPSPQKRMDLSEEKRVELHLHSTMSAMDSTLLISEAVQTAARWGHSAIAVTDHGVVQSYPEFYAACEKAQIKGIFGMEGYLHDDCCPQELDPHQVFVVYDLETTGFSEQNDQIIEIGAVKLQDGKILDRFSSFLNPCMRLPLKIIELTSITDVMLQDAPMPQIALREFAEFCEGSILVGHNATGFDMKFLLTHAERHGLTFPATHLDTLTMSRALLRDMENHKLNTLVEALDIPLLNHHRAVDDAEATAHLFLKLCELWEASGVEQWPVAELENIQFGKRRRSAGYHFVALVQNSEGLRNLYELVSLSHLQYFYRRPRVPRSLLMQLRGGLLIGSACSGGETFRAAVEKNTRLPQIASFYDYLEIQPIGNNDYLIRKGEVADERGLQELNIKIADLADELGKPCVATSDAHFLEKGEGVFRSILQSSQGYGSDLDPTDLHFRSTDEMLEECAYFGEERAKKIVIDMPCEIAAQCEMLRPFPKETCQPTIPGAEEDLIETCYERARELYGQTLPEEVESRLERELGSITKYKFSTLYWTARLLVKKSNEDGYLVGSRGSVGSSLVAFLLGITEVNALAPHYRCPQCQTNDFDVDVEQYGTGCDLPERDCPNCGTKMDKDGFNIPFETFLGFEGDKVPDIDLNFSGEYQPVAHQYTEVMFGKGHVFRAGTISSVQEKTAFGYVKGFLEEQNRTVRRAEMERLALGCCNVKRTTGQHPGGIVVVPEDRSIYEFSPLNYPADRREAGSVTTHFDFNSMHDVLVKLDILGHDDPTMIRSLQDLTGLDPTKIPLDDPETMALFSGLDSLGLNAEELGSEVGTYGIPEFGTNFVRRMLVETRPTTMEELVRISGLSHGTDVWSNNAQELVQQKIVTLKEAVCTRDDIMTYLIAHGMDKKEAFTIMESVRKGKGLKDEWIASMKANDIPKWYIESCLKIKYMFPRAHAAAYVMMAIRIAYCKVHHPAAYYASYFSIRGDGFDMAEAMPSVAQIRRRIREIESQGNTASNTDKSLQTALELVMEMKLRGLDFAPIDIMTSDASRFLILDDRTLLPPLNVIAGLGTKAAQSLVEARKDGPFRTQEEISRRSSVGKSGVELLRNIGCLDGMAERDQMSLF